VRQMPDGGGGGTPTAKGKASRERRRPGWVGWAVGR
jgi:hypothetical protein